MFERAFLVIEWLSVKAAGMTVGELQRASQGYSKRQLETTLSDLVKGGFVIKFREPYGRTGKIVYALPSETPAKFKRIADRFWIPETA